jgi:hypothetical protein
MYIKKTGSKGVNWFSLIQDKWPAVGSGEDGNKFLCFIKENRFFFLVSLEDLYSME